MKRRDVLAVFNRGRISRRALARTDVSRVALSAAVQTNWLPNVLGSMSLRPGTAYLGERPAQATLLPFVFSADDCAILEMTPGAMRVWEDGTRLLERPAVSTAVANGEFDAGLSGWADADQIGAVSDWDDAGFMRLVGARYAEARRRQAVVVDMAERHVRHALRIVVKRGPVLLRIGRQAGSEDVLAQTVLRTGTHSITFTPGFGSVHVEFASALTYPVLIDSVSIEPAGVLSLPTPWVSVDDCRLLRWQQVNDVVFCACDGHRPRRIERRRDGSWSIVEYEPADGPFLTENTDRIQLTPSAISGEIELTASRSVFRRGDEGRLYRLTSQGQLVAADLSGELTYTNAIKVTGVGAGRGFTVTRAGTWSGTLTLERSIGDPGAWVAVATYATNGSVEYEDGLDNTVAYYRIGFASGGYASGAANASLEDADGSLTGVVRLIDVAHGRSATAIVLSDLGGTTATEIWSEGAWSAVNGYPTAVALYEGRLWWAGRGRVWGSVSDAFDSFDPDEEGDAGPINRALGDTADRVNWLLGMQRLVGGTDAAEQSVRSTSFDEPITPTNFNVKKASTQGSAQVPAAEIDRRGVFVQRSGRRAYEIAYDIQSNDYAPIDLTALVPEIGDAGFVRIAVQRQPDTRIHFVRADGTVAMLIRDAAEDVLCWVDWETDGEVEDVCVLPGDVEDRVFYAVRRRGRRLHEQGARDDQCRGDVLSRLADAHVIHEGEATAIIGGLGHLEGRLAVAWGDGADLGEHRVTNGTITLPHPVTRACVGVGYRARYQSAKLIGETQFGTSLGQRARIDHIGLVLADAHKNGLRFGPTFETMDPLPEIEGGAEVAENFVWDAYDEGMAEFPGDWTTDARVCLEAQAPRPCTVLAAVFSIDRQDKA